MFDKLFVLLNRHKDHFTKFAPDDLKCNLCKYILSDANQTDWGERVCSKCFDVFTKEDKDGKVISLGGGLIPYRDEDTNVKIMNIPAQCPFPPCDFQGLIADILHHVENCFYKSHLCERCSLWYGYNMKQQHDKDQCLERLIQYPYYENQITYKSFTTFHLSVRDLMCQGNLTEDNLLQIIECPLCSLTMTFFKFILGHFDEGDDALCSEYVAECPYKCSSGYRNMKDHLSHCPGLARPSERDG